MVITELLGGLGNQMFQYAAGLSLASHNHTELQLDITSFDEYNLRKYELEVFNITATVAKKTEFQMIKKLPRHIYRVGNFFQILFRHPKGYREQMFSFNPCFFDLPESVYLQGYWQSEKYFKNIAPVIYDEFSLKKPLQRRNQRWAEQIRNHEYTVSVHVRHGDYVSDDATNSVHGICSVEYYMNCMRDIQANIAEDLSVFVFSDDIIWAKQNLRWDVPTYYVDGNGADFAFEEMHLMSLCDCHIIANSSFSWWGAWLDCKPNKKVYAPKKWFNNGPADVQDICPIEWIRM